MYSDIGLIMVVAAILEEAISNKTPQATECSAYKAELLLQIEGHPESQFRCC